MIMVILFFSWLMLFCMQCFEVELRVFVALLSISRFGCLNSFWVIKRCCFCLFESCIFLFLMWVWQFCGSLLMKLWVEVMWVVCLIFLGLVFCWNKVILLAMVLLKMVRFCVMQLILLCQVLGCILFRFCLLRLRLLDWGCSNLVMRFMRVVLLVLDGFMNVMVVLG